MIFETFYQSDEETSPDQQKDNEKDKDKDNDNDNDNDKLVACGIWDTDYNSDNWEPEFMTLFVAWQLRVTLDSIRNSCDLLDIIEILTCPWFPVCDHNCQKYQLL